jgi:hypothetical protein
LAFLCSRTPLCRIRLVLGAFLAFLTFGHIGKIFLAS